MAMRCTCGIDEIFGTGTPRRVGCMPVDCASVAPPTPRPTDPRLIVFPPIPQFNPPTPEPTNPPTPEPTNPPTPEPTSPRILTPGPSPSPQPVDIFETPTPEPVNPSTPGQTPSPTNIPPTPQPTPGPTPPPTRPPTPSPTNVPPTPEPTPGPTLQKYIFHYSFLMIIKVHYFSTYSRT